MNAQRFFELIYFMVVQDSNYTVGINDYLDFIFPFVFTWDIIVTLVLCGIFYSLINNMTVRLGYLIYWFLFMVLSAGLNFYIAVDKVASVLYLDKPILSDAWIFAINNALLSMLLFFIFSLVLKAKKLSINGNHLPFKTPW
jgi:hypothetical protein